MDLEWDEEKRRANFLKHGLDFDDARHLDWDHAAYIEDQRFAYPEPRFWAFARWKGRLLHGGFLSARQQSTDDQFP